jgi:hypothetical protein
MLHRQKSPNGLTFAMPSPTVDFRRIRSHHSSQNTGFEELTRQLVLANPPTGHTDIEHRGPGADGGVEILVRFADGTCHGWQSKYFVDKFDAGQVAQLKESFESALTNFPGLTRYVIAIPQNLSGSGEGPHSDARSRWNGFVNWAKRKAAAVGRSVAIELWDDTELVRRLTLPDSPYPGMLVSWFDETAFTNHWFRQQFDSVRVDLGERYSPDDHVDFAAQRLLDTLSRNDNFLKIIEAYKERIRIALSSARLVGRDQRAGQSTRRLAHVVTKSLIVLRGYVEAQKWSDGRPLNSEAIRGLTGRLYRATRRPINRRWARKEHDERDDGLDRRFGELNGSTEGLMGGPHYNEDVLQHPAVLIVGEAGTGKSHAIARTIDTHLQDSAPAALFLGQYFELGDPWPQMVAKLGLTHRSREEILGAL